MIRLKLNYRIIIVIKLTVKLKCFVLKNINVLNKT